MCQYTQERSALQWNWSCPPSTAGMSSVLIKSSFLRILLDPARCSCMTHLGR